MLPRLGLIDDSPSRWSSFRNSLAGESTQAIERVLEDATDATLRLLPPALKKHAAEGTSYKVFYLQRHGQGQLAYPHSLPPHAT